MGFKDKRGDKKLNELQEERATRSEEQREERQSRRERQEEKERKRREERNREERGYISLFDDGNDFIRLGTGGVSMAAFIKHGKESMENAKSQLSANGNYDWDIIAFPASETNFACDAALITQHVKATNTVNTLTVIFAPETPLPKQVARFDDRKEKFSSIPADQYNKRYSDLVRNAVKSRIVGGKESSIVTLFGMIAVPANYPLVTATGDANISSINKLLQHLLNQLNYRTRDTMANVERFRLTEDIVDNYEINAMVSYHGGDEADVFGNPIRSDLSVDIKAEEFRRSRGRDRDDRYESNPLEGNSDHEIGHLAGYPDLSYVPPTTGRSSNFRRGRSRDDDSQVYDLNLMITATDSNQRSTLENQLLVMAGIPMLADENALVKALQPRGDMADLRNPAVMMLDQDEDFPEIPENPSEDEWLDIMEAVVRPKSTQTYLQIDESSINAPLMRYFLEACDNRSKDQGSAQREIEDAAIRLTDGELRAGDLPEDFGTIEPNVIILGHYQDDKGIIRDLREVQDYLSVSTYYSNSDDYTRQMEKWEAACWDDSLPIDWRIAVKEDMLREMTNNRLVVTGHATLVNLNPELLSVLADGISDAGLRYNADGIHERYRGKRGGNYRSVYENDGYRGTLFRRKGRSSRRGRY